MEKQSIRGRFSSTCEASYVDALLKCVPSLIGPGNETKCVPSLIGPGNETKRVPKIVVHK